MHHRDDQGGVKIRLCAHPASRLSTIPATSLSNERLIRQHIGLGLPGSYSKPIKLPMHFCLHIHAEVNSVETFIASGLSNMNSSLSIVSLLNKSNDSLAEAEKLFLLIT